jgi:tripartite-type tricarboxylate transporter receptor subunit TctC
MSIIITRRALLALACACCGLAAAQTYPERSIRMIIPSTPGGGTDFVGRLMASKLQALNGWTLVPENHPGAGTVLGMTEAVRAGGKGYDLVVGQSDNITLGPLLTKVSYDPQKDIVPVALVGTVPAVYLVNENSRWKSLADVIAEAKAKPDTLSYGTSGVGGSMHLTTELLQQVAGVKLHHVPYKGGPLSLADLVGGHLDVVASTVTAALPLIKAGKLRALAVTSATRSSALPNVPTVAELGFPKFEMNVYFGIFAPANTPEPIVARLNADFNKILDQPDVKATLHAQAFAADPISPAKFRQLIATDIETFRHVIQKANVKIEK